MIKINKGAVTVAAFFILFLILYEIGALYFLNGFFPQNPDFSCRFDSDCKLYIYPAWIQCHHICAVANPTQESVIAINKNWAPFCPFKMTYGAVLQCATFIDQSIYTAKAKCVENRCKKVLDWNNSA